MWLGLVSLFPEVLTVLTQYGVVGRGIREQNASINLFNPRDYAPTKHRQVDDKPYGGGAGMLMTYQPLQGAIEAGMKKARAQRHAKPRIVFFSPQGRLLTQSMVKWYASMDALLLVSGCYEGMDERIVARHADDEISIGDYVLSGGELAIMVFINALMRLRAGVLGNALSAADDSFSHGLLEAPQYTRPEEIDGMPVPQVLLSGDHAAIQRWRRRQALGRTWLRRPDLLARASLAPEDKQLLMEFIESHETKNK